MTWTQFLTLTLHVLGCEMGTVSHHLPGLLGLTENKNEFSTAHSVGQVETN